MKLLLSNIFEEFINEVHIIEPTIKHQDLYTTFSNDFKNTPEYIKKEFFVKLIDGDENIVKTIRSTYHGYPSFYLSDKIKSILSSDWVNTVIDVSPSDFTKTSLQAFLERDWGHTDTYQVPGDLERTEVQKKLAKVDGTNEPVILLKRPDGYEVYEGWHRTMSILKLADNGGDPSTWPKVKLNAWITE